MASGFGWGVRLAVYGGGREVVIHAVPDVSASDTDVSASDTFWWPLKNSDRCVSDFLTGVAFRNKPMSETSILDMLIHRREEAKQKLLRAPTSGNETCEKQAACNSFMSSIVAAGESSEAKRVKNRKQRVGVLSLPESILMLVPVEPGLEPSLEVSVKTIDKPKTVTVLITQAILEWLQSFTALERQASTFKRARTGDDNLEKIESNCKGVSWDYTRGAWRATFYTKPKDMTSSKPSRGHRLFKIDPASLASIAEGEARQFLKQQIERVDDRESLSCVDASASGLSPSFLSEVSSTSTHSPVSSP
jgi:hypothetical protein